MNLTIETAINLFLALCGLLTFLLGLIIGRRIGRKEMRELITSHELIASIWKSITIETFKRYDTLLREYVKLAKETKG